LKKQQQHACFVLTSFKTINLKIIDISDPIYEQDKQFMIENSQPNPNGIVLPPQIFNDEEYCGVNHQFSLKIKNFVDL
jgi:hypothetical protein